MRGLHTRLVLLLVAAGLLVSARLTLQAQEGKESDPKASAVRRPGGSQRRVAVDPAAVSVQDAMHRPFSFPFVAPTSLADVCEYLRQTLKAPVVLDLAALDRQEVKPDDQVQLQLEGVRLKTGLKLLLDQVGLTYQIVAEDNLLIVTDTHGSTEPIDRVLSELKALHRDVHDLQDAVDDLSATLGLEPGEVGAKMRKPTIIEEVPGEDQPGQKPQPPASGTEDRPRSRPGT